MTHNITSSNFSYFGCCVEVLPISVCGIDILTNMFLCWHWNLDRIGVWIACN